MKLDTFAQFRADCYPLLSPPQINNNDLREVLHHTAVNHFHEAGEIVTLLVERGAEQRIRVRHLASFPGFPPPGTGCEIWGFERGCSHRYTIL